MPKLIGSAPNQVSVNGMLGDMAFQSSDAVTVGTLTTTGNISTSANVVVPNAFGFKWGASSSYIDGSSASGSSYIALGVNNNDRVRIDNSGNVGIGTASPSTKMDVSVTGGMLRVGGASGNNLIQAYTGNGSTGLGLWAGGQARLYSTTDLYFSTGATLTTSSPSAYSDNMMLTSSGNLGIGMAGSTPTAKLDVNSDTVRVRTSRTPASATATGNAGDICWDANYVYVCTATNTWKRAALSTW